jgi:hypothetical protein
MDNNPVNKLQILAMANDNQIQALSNLIKEVRDTSDFMVKCRSVIFKNGYELSVIYGYGTYGSQSGLFEVAAFDPSGEWCNDKLNPEQFYKEPIGYCSPEEVVSYMFKLGNLT